MVTYDEAGQQRTWVGRTWKKVRMSVQSASQAPVDIDVSGERKHLRATVKGRDTRSDGNMMITLLGVKVKSSKRVERKGVLIGNTASCQR